MPVICSPPSHPPLCNARQVYQRDLLEPIDVAGTRQHGARRVDVVGQSGAHVERGLAEIDTQEDEGHGLPGRSWRTARMTGQ